MNQSTELHRFGIDPTGDPVAQWPRLCQLLTALITNPSLQIGDWNSILDIPESATAAQATTPSSPTSPGAFFRVFRLDGKWMLQGGQVTAGSGSKVIDDIELATVGSEPADGRKVWIEANGNGVVVDGRLFQGFNLDEDATDTDSGTALPDNTLPTVAASSGRKCHVLLGTWTGGRFYPSNIGNIQIGFCPSYYQASRF